MPESAYGLIEMTLSFGVALGFLSWQLVKTRAAVKADRERAARAKTDPAGPPREGAGERTTPAPLKPGPP